MRRRPSYAVKVTVTVASTVLLACCASCEAHVFASPGDDNPAAPQLTVVTPQAPPLAPPAPPPVQSAPSFDGLPARAQQAVDEAADQGATIGVMVHDRETGQQVAAGNTTRWATASVVKLFIADDLLLREPDVSPEDRKSLNVMLRSSDDSAAEVFWNRGGGSAIINRVTARYGLNDTAPPGNGRWWNTITSAQDLVRYYDMLLSGAGGLPPSGRTSSSTTWLRRHRPLRTGLNPAGSIRSDSASPRACPVSRSRSNKGGCAASTRTGCICPRAWWAAIGATSW